MNTTTQTLVAVFVASLIIIQAVNGSRFDTNLNDTNNKLKRKCDDDILVLLESHKSRRDSSTSPSSYYHYYRRDGVHHNHDHDDHHHDRDGINIYHDDMVQRGKEVQAYMRWIERMKVRSTRWAPARKSMVRNAARNPVPGNPEDSTEDDSAVNIEYRWIKPVFAALAESDAVGAGSSLVLVRPENYLLVDAKHGPFYTVQAAVDAVPKHNAQRIIIKIAAGVYEEKVKIRKDKRFITFMGEGADKTRITWHDTSNISHSTFKSASVSVMANGFVARNLAFENSAPAPKPGDVGAQAVAFQISGDQSAFYDCAFYGAQDTLYDHKGRHYFKNCLIQGSIDFVFGDGLSLYEECELRTLSISTGSLTAQKRKTSEEDTGFSFVNCRVTGAGMVYLGRAWGAYSRVVYIHTYIDDIILPDAWNDWGIPSRQKTSFYAIFECFGPGSKLHNEVAWAHYLTPEQATPFMSLSFIDGQSWLPSMS